ncbi:unnamed protein product, partial [Urochloa humidicola]
SPKEPPGAAALLAIPSLSCVQGQPAAGLALMRPRLGRRRIASHDQAILLRNIPVGQQTPAVCLAMQATSREASQVRPATSNPTTPTWPLIVEEADERVAGHVRGHRR